MSHHQRRNHHSRRPPTKTKSSSSSRRLSHADEKPYNPHLYDTHLFCLRLFSLTPLEGSWGRISAGTIPQWTWDVRQCREWVADVLIKREKLSKKDAKSIAERLDCSGAGIYDLEEHEWEEMLYPREKSEEEEKVDDSDDVDDAVEWDGMGKRICAMLARRRSGKGAVPERRRNLRG